MLGRPGPKGLWEGGPHVGAAVGCMAANGEEASIILKTMANLDQRMSNTKPTPQWLFGVYSTMYVANEWRLIPQIPMFHLTIPDRNKEW